MSDEDYGGRRQDGDRQMFGADFIVYAGIWIAAGVVCLGVGWALAVLIGTIMRTVL